jgi:ribosomal protein S18 acetylase RimI-like enzyme
MGEARRMTDPPGAAAAAMISVREVTVDGWSEWRALRLAALGDAPYAFGATLADWRDADEARWRQRLDSVALNLIADLAGQPVGMVSATAPSVRGDRADREVELISMWVGPAGRGHGVGDALIQAVVHWARGQAAARVILAVREGNWQAVSLYERNGFRDAGWASAPTDPLPERRMILTLRSGR